MGSHSALSLTCHNLNQISLRSTSRRVFEVYFGGEEAELGAFIRTLKNICHICENDECNKLASTPAEGGEEKKRPATTPGKEEWAPFHVFILGETEPGDGTASSPTFLPQFIYPAKHQPSATSLLVNPPILNWLASWPLFISVPQPFLLSSPIAFGMRPLENISQLTVNFWWTKCSSATPPAPAAKPSQRDVGGSSREVERKFGKLLFFCFFFPLTNCSNLW